MPWTPLLLALGSAPRRLLSKKLGGLEGIASAGVSLGVHVFLRVYRLPPPPPCPTIPRCSGCLGCTTTGLEGSGILTGVCLRLGVLLLSWVLGSAMLARLFFAKYP